MPEEAGIRQSHPLAACTHCQRNPLANTLMIADAVVGKVVPTAATALEIPKQLVSSALPYFEEELMV